MKRNDDGTYQGLDISVDVRIGDWDAPVVRAYSHETKRQRLLPDAMRALDELWEQIREKVLLEVTKRHEEDKTEAECSGEVDLASRAWQEAKRDF